VSSRRPRGYCYQSVNSRGIDDRATSKRTRTRELLIAKKNRAFPAKISWRQASEAGLTFRPVETDIPISLDWARRLRVCESERRELQGRIAQLLSEH
jgi:hypothetical protein